MNTRKTGNQVKQRKFMKRMMVILMGIILIIAAIVQIIQKTGPLWLNMVLVGLGLFEIGLSAAMMVLEAKVTKTID